MRTRTRLILAGAVSVFTSLLLLYHYSRSLEETDDSRMMKASQPPGYFRLLDQKPLEMHCRRCALVSSSGHMIGSNRGEEIDQTECVIRMNDAPTRRYEKDVGRRTTLRVVAFSSLQSVLRRKDLLCSSQEALFLFWGLGNLMRPDGKGLVNNNLQAMKRLMPPLNLYAISEQKSLQFDLLFKKETGMDRVKSNSLLTTGWFTMVIAIDICDEINVYGLIPPDFCMSPHHHPSVPYHYYETSGPEECAIYLSHKHHRYITEKRVFAKWARQFKIHFYQPDGSPSSVPQSSTGLRALPN